MYTCSSWFGRVDTSHQTRLSRQDRERIRASMFDVVHGFPRRKVWSRIRLIRTVVSAAQPVLPYFVSPDAF